MRMNWDTKHKMLTTVDWPTANSQWSVLIISCYDYVDPHLERKLWISVIHLSLSPSAQIPQNLDSHSPRLSSCGAQVVAVHSSTGSLPLAPQAPTYPSWHAGVSSSEFPSASLLLGLNTFSGFPLPQIDISTIFVPSHSSLILPFLDVMQWSVSATLVHSWFSRHYKSTSNSNPTIWRFRRSNITVKKSVWYSNLITSILHP